METLRKSLCAVIILLAVQAGWAQRMVFSTEDGKNGILSVTFGEIKDNRIDVKLQVSWVEADLKSISDHQSVIGFNPEQIKFNSPLVSYIPTGDKQLIMFNSGATIKVEVDERFPGGDIKMEFPFFYASSQAMAAHDPARKPFVFTRPRNYAATLNVNPSQLNDKTPPNLAILTPEGVDEGLKPIIESDQLRVKLSASDFFGIDKVMVNDVEARLLSDSIYVADISVRYGFETPINVVAVDKSGLRSTESFTIESRRPSGASQVASNQPRGSQLVAPIPEKESFISDLEVDIPEIGKEYENRYALIIGNEDYSSFQRGLRTEADVEFAIRDAITFKLYAKKVLGIPEENIILRTNATAIEMHRALNQMNAIANINEGDAELFVMYAGHGFPDEQTQEPYLIPVDVSGSDLQFGIKLTDFYAKLTEHPTKRVTVFIDACFSGGGREQGLLAARAVRVRPKESPLSGNLIVFAAASGDQSALPWKDKHHGIFTYHVLNKLKESGGELTYGDLSDYLRTRVATRSVMVNQREQNPQTNISPDVENQDWRSWTLR